MKDNHKGFSLVELIVSMAILGIVAVAEITFISSGSQIYHSVLNNVNLQVEAQAAADQMENYLMNCSGGFCFRDNTLHLVNQEGSGGIEYVFQFTPDTNQIHYSTFSVAVALNGNVTRSMTESGLLANHVKDFRAVPKTDGDEHISSVEVTIEFTRRNTAYTASKTVALRNRPLAAAAENEMLQKVCRPSDS